MYKSKSYCKEHQSILDGRDRRQRKGWLLQDVENQTLETVGDTNKDLHFYLGLFT